MRVVSWNVNGLRACAKKGFHKFLAKSRADVVCLQEVRALPEQLDNKTRNPKGWFSYIVPAQRKGYAGVAIYAKTEPTTIISSLPEEEFNVEGRFLVARFGRLSVASVYFPKGSGRDRDNSRVDYKLRFYKSVFDRLEPLRKQGPVFVTGDFNTAHHEIDLARPKTNKNSSGFLPEERAEMDRWVEAGWIDTFRQSHPGEEGHYTWWRQWGNARENNVGWRIDYIFASKSAARRVKDAFIMADQSGSDHCPVGIEVA